MASPCELRLYASSESQAKAAADAGIAEVLRIEHRYSRYRDDSIVGQINAAAGGDPVRVDEETEALLNYVATAYAESGRGVLFKTRGLGKGAMAAAVYFIAGKYAVGFWWFWQGVRRRPRCANMHRHGHRSWLG